MNKKSGLWKKVAICIGGVLLFLLVLGAIFGDEEGDGGSGGPAVNVSELGQGKKAGECRVITLPGGATMEMVWCPPGTFMMGSPVPDLFGKGGEDERSNDETQHQVTLTKGFWMAKYEVTQLQWVSVMNNNPSEHKGEIFPVESLRWDACQEFCKKTGLSLPTEAEWEYACRAGSTGAYAGTGRLEDMGWYAKNSIVSDNIGRTTHRGGKKKPNAWGLYDMHGNVEEWCADWYGTYPDGAVTNPTGAASGERHVLRGGAFDGDPRHCRSAHRHDSFFDFKTFGFRPISRQN